MINICVWGSEAKAERFIMNVVNAGICAIIDNDKNKHGKLFCGHSVQPPQSIKSIEFDLLVICSRFFNEIENDLKELSVEKYEVLSPEYYHCVGEFEKTTVYKYLKGDYILQFEDMIEDVLQCRYGQRLVDYITESSFSMDDYPISSYIETPNSFEVIIEKVLKEFIKKHGITLVHRNVFGFDNYVDSSMGLINLIRYNIAADAYPWMCSIKSLLLSGRITGNCAIDVGSNNGVVTCFLAREFEFVHSFEPSKELCKKAQKNLDYNGMNNVRLNQCGVGQHNDYLTYYEYEESGGGNSFIPQNKGCIRDYPVSIIKLDEYCTNNGIEFIDFLKLDVEGFEPYVVKGSKNLFEGKRIGAICIEVSPDINKNEGEDRDMVRYLIENSFSFFDVKMNALSLDDIANIRVHQDIIGLLNR